MPPKSDPYANRTTRAIDLLLVLFAVAVIVIVVWTSPQLRARAEHRDNRSTPALSLVANDPAEQP